MKSLIISLCLSVCTIASAMAAEFTVSTYEGSNGQINSYISMEGQTVEGDDKRLQKALNEARQYNFSGTLYLTGPGGNAFAGIQVAELVFENNLRTVAWKDCISACSLIWTAGKTRQIHEDADIKSTVQFHPPYMSDIKTWKEYEALHGIHGLQQITSSVTLEFMAYYLKYGIADAPYFMYRLSQSGPSTFFIVTNDNIHIVN